MYWWNNIKWEIIGFVYDCQKVKLQHGKRAGSLQPLPIPEWKWENVTMGFVAGLARFPMSNDSVCVVVDGLTNSAHFIPIQTTNPLRLRELYIDEIVPLHRAPVSIVSDRDTRFMSKFWEGLQNAIRTTLHFSMAFYPQTDRQSERIIQILKDMLRACVLDFKLDWERYFFVNKVLL